MATENEQKNLILLLNKDSSCHYISQAEMYTKGKNPYAYLYATR